VSVGRLSTVLGGCHVARQNRPMILFRFAVLIALGLSLAGCGVTTAYNPPALDYPPGAFRKRDGSPKPLPCLAGTLLCSPAS